MYYMLVRLSINLWVCIPRRERSEDRKCVCASQAKGQQTDLKLDSLSFLTLITKLSAWIFSGLCIPRRERSEDRKCVCASQAKGQQTDLKLDSLSFLTLITKLSAWIFSGLRISGFRQTLNLSSKKPYHTY